MQTCPATQQPGKPHWKVTYRGGVTKWGYAVPQLSGAVSSCIRHSEHCFGKLRRPQLRVLWWLLVRSVSILAHFPTSHSIGRPSCGFVARGACRCYHVQGPLHGGDASWHRHITAVVQRPLDRDTAAASLLLAGACLAAAIRLGAGHRDSLLVGDGHPCLHGRAGQPPNALRNEAGLGNLPT